MADGLEAAQAVRRGQAWDRVLTALHVEAEAEAAGRLDWTLSVDSTVARVHQHGATARAGST